MRQVSTFQVIVDHHRVVDNLDVPGFDQCAEHFQHKKRIAPGAFINEVGQLARRVGLPLRCSGAFTSSKLPDGQAMTESAVSFIAALQCGANFILHSAGWLEGALVIRMGAHALDHPEITDKIKDKYERRLRSLVATLKEMGFKAKMPAGMRFDPTGA